MVSESNKRIIRNSTLLYVRTILCQLIGIYTARKVLEVLGIEDYGIMNLVTGFTSMLTFMNTSMAVATQRYLTVDLGKGDLAAYNRTFSMACLIHVLLALLMLLLAETAGLWFINTHLVIPSGRMVAANWIYHMSVIAFALSIIMTPYTASMWAHEDMDMFAYMDIGSSVARLAIVFMLPLGSFDTLIFYSLLLLCVDIIRLTVYYIYCSIRYAECKIHFRRDRLMFRSFLNFTGWNMFGTIAWILKDQGNSILMNLFGGVTANAAMGVTAQVSRAVTNVFGGFQAAVNPQITKNYAIGDFTGLHRLVMGSSKISFFLILIVALPVFLETPYLLGIWLVTVPEYAVAFIRISLIEAVFQTLSGSTVAALMATGNIKWYQTTVGCTIMLIVPISFVFLHLGFPIETPLAVSLAVMLIAIMARAVFCKIQIRLSLSQYTLKVLAPCIMVMAASLPLPLIPLITMEEGFLRLVATLAMCCLSVVTCSYFIGLSHDERQLAIALVRAGLKKLHK